MSTKAERSLRCGQERDHLFLSLRNATAEEKVRAYRELEKKLLKEAQGGFERQEIKRRITTDLLSATSSGGWPMFAPHLRRMKRLGYSGLDERLLVCVLTSKAAAGHPAGTQKTAELIADIERRTRSGKLTRERRQEITKALDRARQFAGLL